MTPRWPSSSGSCAEDRGRREAGHVERAERVHGHGVDEALLVVGLATTPDRAPHPRPATGDVDHDRQGPERFRCSDRCPHVVVVVDVTGDAGHAVAELFGQRRAPLRVAVEDGGTYPDPGEVPDGCRAETSCATGDDGRATVHIHCRTLAHPD